MTLHDRWLAKVEKSDGCWNWVGAIKSNGYGHLSRGSRGSGHVHAHRHAYERLVGPIPDGLEVRHLCNNRRCVNPDHLDLGTHHDNMQDMVKAGTRTWEGLPGEQNGRSILTAEAVHAIRQDARPARLVGATYGVAESTVYAIRKRRLWAHLPD